MKLDIRHLNLLVAVTEEKSVTKAGARLHLTQSALSHQLRDLEERLGTPLFLRLNKRTIRLSTECYTCYHWLPAHLKEFHQSYPAVEVKIVVEATHRPLQALLDGKLDLAIVSSCPRDKRVVYRPLFKDELVAIMPPAHPLAAKPYLQAKDFADQNVFLYVPPKESTLFRLFFNPAGVTPARVSEVQLTEAIIEMVKAGLGVSVLARWALTEALQSGQLIARPLTKRGLHRQWSAALLKRDLTPSYLPEFVSLLAAGSERLVGNIEPQRSAPLRAGSKQSQPARRQAATSLRGNVR
jgi:LysR family transcriptional regulator, regulator for metE and metH